MTKISSQPAYKPDTEITGKDYLVGTDADKANKPTVSFLLEDLGSHFNMVNGSRNFDFLFYNHLGVSQAPANGSFYSNNNEQNPNNITHFFISKYTSSNKDVSQFFDSITTTNPFDLIVSQKIGLNSIFFFTISDVESINGYYKLTVSEKFFPDSLIVEYKASNLVFNLKPNLESIHNNLDGLNEGDYIHLTEIEKEKFDDLPNSFIVNHSELNLDDGTNPHGTTKANVGLGNVDNTSDVNKPISTATQTALFSKENTANKATTMTGNTTSNIVFLTAKAVYDWAIGLFVPQSRTLTIGGVTQDLSANRTFVVGGGETRLMLNKKFATTFHLTALNTWKANFITDTTDIQIAVGSSSTPNSVFFIQSEFTAIPDGYIIDEVQAYITYKLEGSYNGNLQIYISRSESADASITNGVSNTVEIINETIPIAPGSINLKYIKNLTVNTHSLPTLAKSFLQIAIRDTSIADIYYNINFNIILKKV